MIERALRGLALKAAAPGCKTMTPRDLIDGHEADIVPVIRVFRARIAEANKESHDAASRARLLFLVATAGGPFRPTRRRPPPPPGSPRPPPGPPPSRPRPPPLPPAPPA